MKEINHILLFFIIIFTLLFNFTMIKAQDDDEESDYFIHFDMSDPDIIIVDKDNSHPEIKDIISKSASIKIPKIELDKDDFFFSGWTEDGIYGFEPGDVFLCKTKNVTLKPVFGLLADKRTFTLEYIVEFEGEILDTAGALPKGHYCKNRIVKTSIRSYPQITAVHRGWTDGVNEFAQEQKMVMPEHNVTLHSIYYYYRNLTYVAGNVDGIIGALYDIQTLRAGGTKELAEGTRLNRKGYKMIGWHCENDGKDYSFYYSYIMPDENVIMTAIWEPLNYVINFNAGVSSIPNIKKEGKTGEVITAPYLENKREGYTFVGWKLYDKELYYPGDEILIIGQMPGAGIPARAIWKLN